MIHQGKPAFHKTGVVRVGYEWILWKILGLLEECWSTYNGYCKEWKMTLTSMTLLVGGIRDMQCIIRTIHI